MSRNEWEPRDELRISVEYVDEYGESKCDVRYLDSVSKRTLGVGEPCSVLLTECLEEVLPKRF